MKDLTFLSTVAMAEQVRSKNISPVELVEAHLAQIEKLNPRLNAFVQVDEEGARRAAQDAETAVMQEKTLGPLHGVPISVKSSISVAGLRHESGTRLRAGLVATQDAPLVTRLKNAGAIVLGVTNTPEFLMAWEPTTCSMAAPTAHGTWSAHRAVRAEAKRPRLPRACPPVAWAATVEDRFACPLTSAASAA
jgi:amidase